jgi:undecaprenyl pyrophosphate phosphatase UppP
VTAFELAAERHQVLAAGPSLWWACAVGGVAAAGSGLVALRIVIATVGSRVFHRFSWYCLPLGLAVILLATGVL